jgi:hypothetical protein
MSGARDAQARAAVAQSVRARLRPLDGGGSTRAYARSPRARHVDARATAPRRAGSRRGGRECL